LAAGEEASVSSQGRFSKMALANVDEAIAWRERRLVFKETPLAQVVEQFNRYNKSQLRIEGDALGWKLLTGTFSVDHPQSLILYLSEFRSLTVMPEGDDWVVRPK
jgi:transmembrane sensor